MTAAVTHLARLLRWGRTLARHGALMGIERDVLVPAKVRRLARLARFGARVPKSPNYALAFEKLGPAAIKLGQALATRPDLVGAEAAADLARLQDNLPPLPFEQIRAAIEAGLGKPIEQVFASIDPVSVGAASIAQVHRAVTTEGRHVAIKVLRPGVEEVMASAIETYEWAAAHAEAQGGELKRLRPRQVIATFRQWTMRELDLRREAASASELAEGMKAEPGFFVPDIDWSRTSRRVMTLDWIDGIRIGDREALIAAGHDPKQLAATLVRGFLRQAIIDGFFHADLHQGNLFVLPDGRIATIDFGIMGRVNRQARLWLAEILHGLVTGNYRRVAEIHFDAQYVPGHHNIDEFTTALRAVGEPIRGLALKDISIGHMLDGLFAITRDFEMPTQPHLLLLQKTMVMVEGVALTLDPDINMWDTSGPFVKEWLRTELGPEVMLADGLRAGVKSLLRLPDLLRRIDNAFPTPGAAPPPAPLPDIRIIGQGDGRWFRTLVTALIGAVAGAVIVSGATSLHWLG